MFQILLLTLFLMLSAISLFAQTPTASPKTISGGVLNGKATSLPKPIYPPEARSEKASGAVSVQVLIDESGTIISAKAVSGHPLLRAASEAAAREARFSPTTLQGQPIKVSGVITYNFVASKPNEEVLETLGLSMCLHWIRGSVNDLDKLNRAMDSPDFIQDLLVDIPSIGKETEPLLTLKTTPVSKRLEIVDGVIAAAKAKQKDDWQFELGRNLGDFFAQIIGASDENGPIFSKLNEVEIKALLARIKIITGSAPPDFPRDVLQKLKDFSELSEAPSFRLPESSKELVAKLMQLIETISPESNK